MKQASSFDWTGELNKTVTKSLVITFGLDFLLVQDKHGGDVDTIHNVRKGIWATDKARSDYENRGDYNSHNYHSDDNYINKGRQDKQKQQTGELHDAYRNTTLKSEERRDLDHILPTKKIHDDAGRVLAEKNGIELANQDSNFQSTYWKINRSKGQKSVSEFLQDLPKTVEKYEKKVERLKSQQANAQGQEKLNLQRQLKQAEDDLKAFQNIDGEAMLRAEKKAEQSYNQSINEYYKSSKFLQSTGKAAIGQGFAMGTRQAVGLILAEIWFELKIAIPSILKKCQTNFSFEMFWNETKNTISHIFERIKIRFKDILSTFKDSFLGGILSSITTTVLNIFLTTSKLIVKMIRESWDNLVQIIKLLVINPQNLSSGDVAKEVIRLTLASVSTILGVALHQHLQTVLTIPFGTEIAAFLSALFTGFLMMGTAYFIDYSPIMQKVWQFLNSLKNEYDVFLDHIKEANARINEYVTNLAKIEFNLNTQEIQALSYNLSCISSEEERNALLKLETQRRGIQMPFEMGNRQSTVAWLQGKIK